VKVIAIIQARMGSTRLPRKILSKINGKPMLYWVLERVRAVKEIDEIVVATTINSEDDILEQWLNKNEVFCFRGDENDVLARFYNCAQNSSAEIIVRITADDPLKDPDIMSYAIGVVVNDPAIDYCSNTIKPSFPEGLDIEVFRYQALEKAYHEAILPSEREHVTPYIWKNTAMFNLSNFVHEKDLSSWRWTVDKRVDLEFIREIYAHFRGSPLVSYTEIIEYIETKPELMEINSGIERNEGYSKSLKLDKRNG
jgi:spore coat polysaccharide biosynthesis protein SpsF